MIRTNSFDILLFARSLAFWLFTWSWQTCALVAIAWGAVKLDLSRSATTRFRIWLSAVVMCAAIPALDLFFSSLPTPASKPLQIVVGGGPFALSASSAPAQTGWPWLSIVCAAIGLLWLTGVGASVSRLAASLWRLNRIKAEAEPLTLEAAERLDLTEPGQPTDGPAIAFSDDVRSPGVAGILRPVILLPDDIAAWTTPEERIAMLRHEAAHIARRDHITAVPVSLVRALLFFHPMVHLACNRLNLERELACDDWVLTLGSRAGVYAEAILKAVERSMTPDIVHPAPLFISMLVSKKTLERRIEMILTHNRKRMGLRQWRFLLLPAAALAAVTWLVMPPASGTPRTNATASSPSAAAEPKSAPALSAGQGDLLAISKDAIWTDTVKRGDMSLEVAGLGKLTSVSTGAALLFIPEDRASDIVAGQNASVVMQADGPSGGSTRVTVQGKVVDAGQQGPNGQVAVDVALEGSLPERIAEGSRIEGRIQYGRLNDVLYIGLPVNGRPNTTAAVFKVDPDGQTATRVMVRFGVRSVNTIQVSDGLSAGEQVILSDTSGFQGVNKIAIK